MNAQSQHKPIGQLNQRLTGGPEPTLYGKKPIYGKRQQYLPSPANCTMFQVQICFLGSLVWINVDPRDVK
jgi:hypothetical protein